MKALLNPETNMVLEWTELRAKMGHLQEIQITNRGQLSRPLSKDIEGEVLSRSVEVFPTATVKYGAKVTEELSEPTVEESAKKAAKKTAGKKNAKPAAVVDTDDFNVDNL